MAVALAHDQDGWFARLELEFERRSAMTVLRRNRHTGPLRLQRPLYPENESVCHAYVLHPPGGVVGGDRLEIDVTAQAGAGVLITTPGAAKFYRSNGATAVQESRLEVAENSCMEWMPQESIFYPGADASVATRVALGDNAGFIGWDILCIGLPACGRTFGEGRLKTTLEVRRKGRLLLKDRLWVQGDAALSRPAGLRGFSVCATMIATGCTPRIAAPLKEMAEAAPEMMTGITLMQDLLVVRGLCDDSALAKALFSRLWGYLRPALFGRDACPPRIWET